MEDSASGFDDFSIEMGDLEVRKKRNVNLVFYTVSYGGSVDNRPMVHNGAVYFGCMNRNVYAVDIDTQDLVWKFETQGSICVSSPSLYKDSLIVGSYDYNVYRIDLKTGKMIWKFRTRGEVASAGTVKDGVYYFTGRDKLLYAINCEDGSLLWKYKTFESNVSVPAIYGNMVFFASSDRNIYCIDRIKGNLIWKFEAEEEIVNENRFMIVGNILYFMSVGSIFYAIDIRTGRPAWKLKLGEYGSGTSPAFLNGLLLQSSLDGVIFAITPEGRVAWKIRGNYPFGSITIDGERAYASCEDKNLYCIDGHGKILWKFRTEGALWQPATIVDGVVYFGSYDCNLYAVDALKGTLLWKYRCSGSPSSYMPLENFFEVTLKLPEAELEKEGGKRYEMHLGDEGADNTSTYKSRITYQVSTQYASKGKYQVDSDEEEF
jgi:outer membrane protein assembly factor BamB